MASRWLACGEDAAFHVRAGKQLESSAFLQVSRRSI